MQDLIEIDERFDPSASDPGIPLRGHIDPRFAPVLEAFKSNFRRASGVTDLGASVCVMIDGRPVVDLWGGFLDKALTTPWDRDTLICLMSNSKPVSAVALHMLVDRGAVDLDAPVATYWPEFAEAGKASLKVRHVLDHRSGLPVLTDRLWPGAIFDYEAIVGALAAQTPLWEPGTQAGYHTWTIGFLIGEIVRRVSGKRLGPFLREHLTTPLGMDYYIGLTPAEEERCGAFFGQIKGTVFDPALAATKILERVMDQFPDDDPFPFDGAAWRQGEVAGGNGHGTARSLARMYAALVRGGELDGVRILSPKAVDTMTAEQHFSQEIVVNRHYHQALGILRNSPPYAAYGPNPRAFGGHGFGGSMAFGDPDTKLSFAYGTNVCHQSIDQSMRAVRLWTAAYSCL